MDKVWDVVYAMLDDNTLIIVGVIVLGVINQELAQVAIAGLIGYLAKKEKKTPTG
jgi:hypothetical protein